MKVIRDKAVLKKMSEQDNDYVDIMPAERVSFIWDITSELWFLKGNFDAQQRLQRNVANLIRQRG